VEKYGKSRHATDYNIILRGKDAICVLDNLDTNTETHTQDVFPWQQWLRERAPMLRYSKLPVLFIHYYYYYYYYHHHKAMNQYKVKIS
jgi:hypothetical protein